MSVGLYGRKDERSRQSKERLKEEGRDCDNLEIILGITEGTGERGEIEGGDKGQRGKEGLW